MIQLPPDFLNNSQNIIPENEFISFTESFSSPVPVSIRYNCFKASTPQDSERVKWCRDGVYLEQRPKFTLDPLFHGGVYYVQEASSMFVEKAFEAAVKITGNDQLRVLDLCAAPGGKTTHLASLVGSEGLVVANEVISSRSRILAENCMKWGSGNIIVSNSDPAHFAHLGSMFDIVLIDAPCSGEGLFRRDNSACSEWSNDNVELCASRSKRIIASAWDALREGGVLIYSTCTFNRREDEDMLDWIAQCFEIEPIEIETEPEWGVTCTEGENGGMGYKFLPHKVKGEGLFMAAMVKKESAPGVKKIKKERFSTIKASKDEESAAKKWIEDSDKYSFVKKEEDVYAIEQKFINDLNILQNRINVVTFGISMGRLFGKEFKPAHDLALFCGLNRQVVPMVELPLEVAQDYLRKKDIDSSLFEKGVNIVAFEGVPIGFIKKIGARCNNMYPKQLRIYNL